jgi:hypothetical protein
MAILRVPVAIVPSSQHYQARVAGLVTVGEVARYLSQHEAQIEVNTLEIARPALPDQRVETMDIQGGDRLVIFTHAARPVELPAPARPGDKAVRFSLGDTTLRSGGKKSLMVGKPEAGFIPDLDLRHFITPRALEFVSADCMRLYFDEGAQVWYATRSGDTRILLDELELERQPVALNDAQWVRFYRAGDARPLGEMRMTLETVQVGDDVPLLPPGQEIVHMQIGLERENQALRVSGNIRAGQIASSLAQHHGLPVTNDLRLYVARLAPPQTSLDALELGEGALLYAALKLRYAEHVLLLRDIQQRDHTYTLVAGQGEQLIGCRSEAALPQPDLDIDLYESIMEQGYDPRPFQGMSPYFARITYRTDEQSWWVWSDERSQVPLFVNNARASRNTALPLAAGDVVSIGPSLNSAYARLEVEG